jgi:hypothetical protein
MGASVIVWDIETVPDLKGFAQANGHDGKSDDDIRAAMGDKFPKHIYHSIVCKRLAYLLTSRRSIRSERQLMEQAFCVSHSERGSPSVAIAMGIELADDSLRGGTAIDHNGG